MLSTLPKGRAALEKVAKLTDLELAILDMHVAAAFMRPDSHLEIVDYIPTKRGGRMYEIFVVQIDIALLVLVLSEGGRLGVNDIHLTRNLLDEHTATPL
jgi:hypothetical protein